MEKLCQPQRISDEEPSLYAAVGKGNGTHLLKIKKNPSYYKVPHSLSIVCV